jgi:hypothetical protein
MPISNEHNLISELFNNQDYGYGNELWSPLDICKFFTEYKIKHGRHNLFYLGQELNHLFTAMGFRTGGNQRSNHAHQFPRSKNLLKQVIINDLNDENKDSTVYWRFNSKDDYLALYFNTLDVQNGIFYLLENTLKYIGFKKFKV